LTALYQVVNSMIIDINIYIESQHDARKIKNFVVISSLL
jgi:hypothetical protein